LWFSDDVWDVVLYGAKRCGRTTRSNAGGGYVMTTGDEVPPTTKLDNLKAMAEVAEEYGRY
jgi:uroporphyrinogen-III decarboxylase